MSNPIEFKVVSKNIQMGAPRDRTNVSSLNSSRESSMLSKASFIDYSTHMEAQSADPN